jgi:16S rRNA (uracil1498-N3)-methyltransferase
MHRFFIDKKYIGDAQVSFPDDITHQIQHVLRLREGDQVLVLDNTGRQYSVLINQSTTKNLKGEILSSNMSESESPIQLHLFISLTQREKFEWILQKCTEIGVTAFHPFISSRSLVKISSVNSDKLNRWRKIIKEAAEQSERGIIPELYEVERFESLITQVSPEFEPKYLAWEEAQVNNLLQPRLESSKFSKMALFIGPEGGFANDEVMMAQDQGFLIISLGRRILRVETAAIVACTLVLHAFNEI